MIWYFVVGIVCLFIGIIFGSLVTENSMLKKQQERK